MLVRLTLHPAAVPVPTVIVPRPLPTVAHHAALPAGAGLTQLVLVVYLTESAKYASSAVTMFRRSDFIEEMYAISFVLANFGIAMAARMPMITTTINSSISVKPLRFIGHSPSKGTRCGGDLPTPFNSKRYAASVTFAYILCCRHLAPSWAHSAAPP